MFSSIYVHDLDPVLIRITETIAVRWYGLAYIAGFVAAYWLLRYLSRKNLYPVPREKLADYITLMAIFGVLIGGRLGYVLFYQIPREGISLFMQDWTSAFRVWEGGMASHGGILGVILFICFYAWRHHMSALALMDGVAVVAPIGLFFGRIANFINGELYGRLAPPGSSVAMKFPAEAFEPSYPKETLVHAVERSLGTNLPGDTFHQKIGEIIRLTRENETVREIVGAHLPPRYPSQLFEAAAEGLLLFAVLWWVRMRFPKAPKGLFCSLFCFLYAAGRIVTECFREPDAPLWMGVTRGQYLSFFLVIGGCLFLIPVWRERRRRSFRD
ncbi:MAG: prolipoprotein diacylglyceryl transferase [Akkermansia sp.]|nr:prolipoprotein diacylglyceryl transferase [Akkermansia sp.]